MMKKFMALMLIAGIVGAPVVNAGKGDRKRAAKALKIAVAKAAEKAAAEKPSWFSKVKDRAAAVCEWTSENKGRLATAIAVASATALFMSLQDSLEEAVDKCVWAYEASCNECYYKEFSIATRGPRSVSPDFRPGRCYAATIETLDRCIDALGGLS